MKERVQGMCVWDWCIYLFTRLLLYVYTHIERETRERKKTYRRGKERKKEGYRSRRWRREVPRMSHRLAAGGT
jgi:hypothetical protein